MGNRFQRTIEARKSEHLQKAEELIEEANEAYCNTGQSARCIYLMQLADRHQARAARLEYRLPVRRKFSVVNRLAKISPNESVRVWARTLQAEAWQLYARGFLQDALLTLNRSLST